MFRKKHTWKLIETTSQKKQTDHSRKKTAGDVEYVLTVSNSGLEPCETTHRIERHAAGLHMLLLISATAHRQRVLDPRQRREDVQSFGSQQPLVSLQGAGHLVPFVRSTGLNAHILLCWRGGEYSVVLTNSTIGALNNVGNWRLAMGSA